MNARRKALLVALGMGAAAGLSAWARPRPMFDERRRHQPLEELFPREAGEWKTDRVGESFVLPANEQGKVYEIYDQVLERTYVNPAGQRVMLSVAYGGEQSARLQMHRPEICYGSGGFEVDRVHATQLRLAGRPVPATRLVARRRARIEPITYWTTLGDEVSSDARSFRLRQLALGLRGAIPDGMLVRISSIDADADAAWRLQEAFAARLAQAMPVEARRRVLGAVPGDGPKGAQVAATAAGPR